ncbi:hypothetical protein M3Y99_01362400 [Aphelenchoides fujianensis]|nr:hypothetical protein M3Y99_01362400 [Aphelenchoides fujianensis]
MRKAGTSDGFARNKPLPEPSSWRPWIRDEREVWLQDVRQLTFGGVHSSPTISDDGRFLVFAARDSPHAAAHYGHECKQLYALELERANATPRLVSNRFGTFESAAFLPAGHSLVVASNLRNFEPLERRTPAETCGGWAADGVEERAAGNFDLFELPLERAHRPVPLTRNRRPLSALQVAASARRQVAFVGAEAAGRRLWLLNATETPPELDAADRRRRCEHRGEQESGRPISLHDHELCIADLRQPEREFGRVLHSTVAYAQPAFHADGRRLFASGRPHRPPLAAQIFLVDPNSQSTEQITFAGENFTPVMSRDGRWFVWTSTRNSAAHSVDLFVARFEQKSALKKFLNGMMDVFSGRS